MSGHSKWATIHRQKEVKDAARGKLFSKLARAITIAAKTGGGVDPDTNPKLREMIDKAKSANMPKDNIERALSKLTDQADMFELVYEGFGPFGIGVLVEVATDNKNRTGAEIKNIFDRNGGSFAGVGAVSFNFEHLGFIFVEKSQDPEAQMLSLIDLDAKDIVETEDGIEVYTESSKLFETKKKIQDLGMNVLESDLIRKPINTTRIEDPNQVEKVNLFLETLHDHDDVQKVFSSADLVQ